MSNPRSKAIRRIVFWVAFIAIWVVVKEHARRQAEERSESMKRSLDYMSSNEFTKSVGKRTREILRGNRSKIDASNADVTGTYEGHCENQTYGTTGPMRLTVQEKDGRLSGFLELGGDFFGSGEIGGEIKQSQLTFTTMNDTGEIAWSGTIQGDTIQGSYIVDVPVAIQAQYGTAASQRGIWKVARK